jgi:cell wall-associated NlpC family hydrolase
VVAGGCSAAAPSSPTAGYAVEVSPVVVDARSAERKIEAVYASWRGVRHRLGGVDRSGIDCSAFVQMVYEQQFGVRLPRTTRQLRAIGQAVGTEELTPGDLLFFRPDTYPRHVGIYLGSGRFVHVSARKGVMVSRLDAGYWSKHFAAARRVLRYAAR